MRKIASTLKKHTQKIFNPTEFYFQEAYAKENLKWDGKLPESIYRFHYNMGMVFRWSLGNPFTVKQIRENELWVKPGKLVNTTMNIWIRTIPEFREFTSMFNERLGEKGCLSICMNGHLVIFCKVDGKVRMMYSNRVKEQWFVEKNYNKTNDKVFRGEDA